MQLKSIDDVVAYQQCTGCGACAYLEPSRFIMVDVPAYGRRPEVKQDAPAETGHAFAACPGKGLSHEALVRGQALPSEMHPCWGPISSVYEGHAQSEEVRWEGSSGGVATALSIYAVEKMGMSGVLQTSIDPSHPHLNKTVYNTGRPEIIAACGSRYSPASPCDGLSVIENESRKSVFVGKPCDVAAVRMAAKQNERLREKIGLTVAFFCAGVPSTEGLALLLRRSGVPSLAQLQRLKFRGRGWPGKWEAEWVEAGKTKTTSLTYEESWGFLESHRQWRCRVCADHTGEFADVSVGDPWYREITDGEPGSSLIVARTAAGKSLLEDAISSGFITAIERDSTLIDQSQGNLIKSRGMLWGRLAALGLIGAPRPTYRGFPAFRYWWRELTVREKVQSVIGTWKRAFKRGLHKPLKLRENG